MILSYTQQLMTSQIRSHIDRLTQIYFILTIDEKSSLSSGLLFWPPCNWLFTDRLEHLEWRLIKGMGGDAVCVKAP